MNISKLGKSCANFLFSGIKKTNVAKTLPQKVQVKKVADKDLFCHQYWADARAERVIRQSNRESVSLHGELHGINHHFILSPYPEHMNMKFMNTGLTPREMISLADTEFKTLKPLEQNLNVYRCVGEKPDFFSEYPLYLKRLGVKKGDIIDMKEYAYATSDISYAKVYMPNNRGVLYEIEVPKGSKVSRTGIIGKQDEIVFPRSSKFECTDVKHIKDGDTDCLHVKLKYIVPEDVFNTIG